MGWLLLDTRFEQNDGLLVGDAEDDGLRCFYDPGSRRWTISDTFEPVLKCDGEELFLKPYTYNANPVYANADGPASGAMFLFRPAAGRDWILFDRLVEPSAWRSLDDTKWEGDGWYAVPYVPSVANDQIESEEIALEPRGRFQNEDEARKAPTIRAVWNRWLLPDDLDSRLHAPFGAYEHPLDGTVRYVGLPRWKGSDGLFYTRTAVPNKNGYHSYGPIRFDEKANLWTIGVYGSETGWWQGREPNRKTPTRYEKMKIGKTGKPEIDPSEPAIELAFDRFVAGETKRKIYMGDLSRWR